MVMLNKSATFLVMFVMCLSIFSMFAPFVTFVRAQDVTYSVSQEWVKVQVNTDSSIDVLYNISYTYLSGSPQGIFRLGMPKAGFQIQYVEDLSGSSLQYRDVSSGSYYGIDVYIKQPIVLNQPYSFVVHALVPAMVFPDSMNTGNVGLRFYPSTFDSATGSEDLRVEIVLPAGVQTSEVKSPTDLPFDNVFVDENRTAVFWERTTWSPSQTFTAGVSFPQRYMSPTPSGGGGSSDLIYPIIIAVVFFVIAIIIVKVLVAVAKAAYVKPSISVEALGANRTLTSVEAGLVMGLKPIRVLTMMLYGLLLKRKVAVTEAQPLLRLQKIDIPTGESTPSLRYYEIDFLTAIKPDGTLDEVTLARTYQGLVNTVDQKLRGYSREDTMNYYHSIVDSAWKQVSQAGTPELMGDTLNKNLDWLLADDKFDDRFATAFPPDIIIYPNPAWWWYWGGPRLPSQPRPSQPGSSTGPTAGPVKTTPLPGQDFANNVVRGLQSASNSLVKNVQDFSNKLVPFQSKPNSRPVSGKPSCVCACHACACACACVSCACACAGGGAR